MSYYKPCPVCSAHLDPSKTCDCEKEDNVFRRGYEQGRVGK